MILSDIIVSYLEQFGVDYVFSVPGGPIGPMYDALARSEKRGGPRSILARHENGAAFMADGYARETGKIGVCLATTGPGATNLITGVAEAYADEIPLLVITGQTELPDFSMGAFQESSADVTDIVGMFHHCTCYNSLVSHPAQLERKLAAALITALKTPRGPAHLSIPTDILLTPAKAPACFSNLISLLPEENETVDLSAYKRLSRELHETVRQKGQIVLLMGHNCKNASNEIMHFAELINAPVISTQRGKACINAYHPLYRGVFGFAGHQTARETLNNKSVNLILAVGTNLNAWSTAGWDKILLNNRLIHVDHSTKAFTRSPMARLHVYGSVRTIFRKLVSEFKSEILHSKSNLTASPCKEIDSLAPNESAFVEQDSSYVPPQIEVMDTSRCLKSPSSPLKPQYVFRRIIQGVPLETRFLIDNSNSVPWTIHYFFHPRPENYHLSIGFASMGWAIGASIGIALGAKKIPLVCFTGDGCFLMSGQEITVAVKEKLPIIFVILNDHAYGMIKHRHALKGTEIVDLSIPPVDFCMMAKAVGANACTIRKTQDLDQIDFKDLCKREGPTLLDVYIDPEETPPLV